MSIIKTANYLVGATTVPLNAKPMSQDQLKYANVDEFVEDNFLPTTSGYKISKKAFGTRNTYPKGIKHIFLHHTATKDSLTNKNIVDIFNKRSFEGNYASSHRGINYKGQTETYIEDKYRAYCQGVTGYNFNYTGMSVELISLGYLIDQRVEEPDGVFYKQSEKHNKKYWVPESKTALAVDFNGNEKEFKGYARWNAYSQAQVDATVKLIREWGTAYKIPFVFDQKAFNDMFMEEANPQYVQNTPGVYSHCSVKQGKFDIYPDPLLVAAFKKEFPKGNSLDF